ncbi:molybdopterin molybdotransferase MoeA [Roseinatronobacter alkalisoli]|uniref:Molybdopterin molybdenumtransferase n=1 Tax=Roseinatronobacter alkalisoli TaxID=3028235 RepID=A0ABT5T7V8_9RHOB|nr:molybdopterin molybdotransferase MoeA [Roseinatronobacter sp. HJB301]MDD7970038.1 molybdopterin molybdotransferase MoeA [Roseinatronobacter sp. HJB301]
MITPEEALARVFALVQPLSTEDVPLEYAAGRVLRHAVTAGRDQPPFAASAMDGYGVTADAQPGDRLRVTGQAAAGHAFPGGISTGEAVRIFTGAPVPAGVARVVLQEDIARDGDLITLPESLGKSTHIRAQAVDFKTGDTITAPRRLSPVALALLAAMNCPNVTVSRRPDVAIIATGDELVMPGETPRADQIIASNAFAIKALAEAEGAQARILPIAADTETSLRSVFELAAGADMIVTIGGASVGDHDLVGPVVDALGTKRSFYKIAMRPGKPLMAGKLKGAVLLGLPGNPVSSIVCAHLFMRPALRAMQGLGQWPMPSATAALGCDLPANGPRTHYIRAALSPGPTITPMDNQDSSLLTMLASADALLVHPAGGGPRKAGEQMRYIPL